MLPSANLITELQQIVLRHFIDADVHHDFSAILVDALKQVANQPHVLCRVAHSQTVRRIIRNDDRLRTAN